MATAAAPLAHVFRPGATLNRYGHAPARVLVEVGQMISFALTAIGLIPFAIRRYPKEMLRMVEDAQLEGTIGTAEEALRLVGERFPIANSKPISPARRSRLSRTSSPTSNRAETMRKKLKPRNRKPKSFVPELAFSAWLRIR